MPSTGAPLNKTLAGALKKAKQLARAEGGGVEVCAETLEAQGSRKRSGKDSDSS